VSSIRGSEAKSALDEVLSTPDPAVALANWFGGMDDKTARYLLGKYSYEYFAKHYIPQYFGNFSHPLSPKFHGEMFPILRDVETHRVSHPAIIAGWPGCGKTVCISNMLPLHSICYGHFEYLPDGKVIDRSKKYILFLSANGDIAAQLMGPTLHELEMNQRIKDDFGDLYRDPEGLSRRRMIWSHRRAVTHTGVYLECLGVNASLRSKKWLNHRPDLGILDDVDKDESATSNGSKSKNLIQRYTSVIAERFDDTNGNIIVSGNRVNEASLIARLAKYGESHGWHVRTFRVFEHDEKGNRVYTWPERFGPSWEESKLDALMGNRADFDREFLQHTITSESDFTEVTRYKPDELAEVLRECDLYIAMDPAAKQSNRADFTAVVPLAYHAATAVSYVLPCTNIHCKISRQASLLIEMYIAYISAVSFIKLGCEAVGFQTVLAPLVRDEAEKEGLINFPIEEILNAATHGDKYTRSRRLFPLINNGRIKFSDSDPVQNILIDQLSAIARGVLPENDDLADAMEMANRMRELEMALRAKRTRGYVYASIGTSQTNIPVELRNAVNPSHSQESNISHFNPRLRD